MFLDVELTYIGDRICEKGSCSLSNCMHLTVHCETCEYDTSLKFGYPTLLTLFYSWEQFHINRMNTLWAVTNWSWKLRKAIRPLFADPVTLYARRDYLSVCIIQDICHNNSISFLNSFAYNMQSFSFPCTPSINNHWVIHSIEGFGQI